MLIVFTRQPRMIVHPVFGGERGHPPLIPAAMIPDILAWPGTDGLRGFLAGRSRAEVEVETPDRFILSDIDTPTDYDKLLDDFRSRDIPTPEECDVIPQSVHPGSPDVLRHSCKVARVAETIGAALIAAGSMVNPDMLHAAGMLHDIAKGHPSHAQVGGRWLQDMGFEHIGNIVAAHTDPDPDTGGHLTEKAIVYLADKLVRKDKQISIEQRFAASLDRYADDPDTCRNIIARRDAARRTIREIEAVTGRRMEHILSSEKYNPGPEARISNGCI